MSVNQTVKIINGEHKNRLGSILKFNANGTKVKLHIPYAESMEYFTFKWIDVNSLVAVNI